jgi:hypothetical protein
MPWSGTQSMSQDCEFWYKQRFNLQRALSEKSRPGAERKLTGKNPPTGLELPADAMSN